MCTVIGVPTTHPKDALIENLNQQLKHFFGSGKKAQQIPSGVSAELVGFGTSVHQDRLKAERAKLAPLVRAMAGAGTTAAATAAELKMRVGRVKLIAHENGFKFSELS